MVPHAVGADEAGPPGGWRPVSMHYRLRSKKRERQHLPKHLHRTPWSLTHFWFQATDPSMLHGRVAPGDMCICRKVKSHRAVPDGSMVIVWLHRDQAFAIRFLARKGWGACDLVPAHPDWITEPLRIRVDRVVGIVEDIQHNVEDPGWVFGGGAGLDT